MRREWPFRHRPPVNRAARRLRPERSKPAPLRDRSPSWPSSTRRQRIWSQYPPRSWTERMRREKEKGQEYEDAKSGTWVNLRLKRIVSNENDSGSVIALRQRLLQHRSDELGL